MRLFCKTNALLVTILLMGCQSPKPDDVPPVEVQFHHTNVNKQYHVNVTIKEPNTYRVAMNYYPKKPEEYKLFSTKKTTARDIEEIETLGEILGLKFKGKFEDIGVPANYIVKIYDYQKGRYIVNETIYNPITGAVSTGRYATLAIAYLVEGQYTVYVTYLGGSTRLNNLYTKIFIKRNHHGK